MSNEAECYESFAHPEHDWTEEGRKFHCPGVVAYDWRNYADMGRDELIGRLRHAEDVCVYFGWTGADNTTRGHATTELWMRWARLDGVHTDVASNADLAGAEKSLADARRAKRDEALKKMRGDS
jgi:hypothetical protein